MKGALRLALDKTVQQKLIVAFSWLNKILSPFKIFPLLLRLPV